MNIGDLPLGEVNEALKHDGLSFKTGPLAFSVRSPIPALGRFLHTIYRDHSLTDEGEFIDFHVRVRAVSGVRSFIRPQAVFDLDGMEPFHPLPLAQAVALAEWGMNWCVYSHAHFFLVIHGAVLERHGQALLLPAPSGSGKSTLCAALMTRGWRLLSDELILIDPTTRQVRPICRPVSLKNQSIDVIHDFAPSAEITAPIPDTAKGTVAHVKPTGDSCLRDAEPATPRWVLFPKYSSAAELSVEGISRADFFMQLVSNAFNYSVLGSRGFELLADVVEGMDGFSAEYGDLDSVVAYCDQLSDRE